MEATTKRPVDIVVDRTLEVETPERVAIGYELAGLGSRFTALLLDGLIVVAGLIALLLGAWIALGAAPAALAGVIWAVVVVLAFLWGWGYFVFLEGRRDGQTVGKRRLGIRVVHEGGYPLSMRGAMIRNLLRIVDAQPAVTWLLGGVVMLIDSRTRRLGDLAAGTVVVAERRADRLPEEVPPSSAVGAPRLEDAAYTTLSRYVERRVALEGAARKTVADRLAAPLEKVIRREGDQTADDYLVWVHRDEQARRRAAGLGSDAGSARATALVRRQRARWAEYRCLMRAIGRGGAERLGEEEVSRFAALYREIAADLARARTYGGSASLIYTLERLVGAGHNLLYRRTGESWRGLVRFLAGGFPSLVRRRWLPIALAAGLFFGPSFVVFNAVGRDAGVAREIMPPDVIARAETAAERQAEGRGYADVPPLAMPIFASSVITNNIQVTFTAFAGGIAAGLGTIAVLILNGVILGGVAGVFAYHQANLYLWSFVLPHGVIELTAIIIAGGAGLLLGSALILPGRVTRREALIRRGREAIALIVGTAMLLVLAGLVEGFISPSRLPAGAKIALATLFAGTLAAYLGIGGRTQSSPRRFTSR